MDEKLKVFIVDDSTVFRSQIRGALEGQAGIEVVGFATDGKMACEALMHKKVDVVTLDLEMPVMNGLATLEELRRQGNKAHVLIFSSHTKAGAESTLSALRLGADDFLVKPQMSTDSTLSPTEMIRSVLLPKINQFRTKPIVAEPSFSSPNQTNKSVFPKLSWASFNPQVIVIASSTGGPSALEKLFSCIQNPLACPILIAQHMPPIFTLALAERLQRTTGLQFCEAENLSPIIRGKIYIAPGGYHMVIGMNKGEPAIFLNQDPLRNSVRPAADFLFESAVKVFKNAVLGIVLTGMGADGRDGAVAIKQAGGGVLIQDKETCSVFGMPGAVYADNAFDRMSNLPGIANSLVELSLCGKREGK